MKKTEKPDYKSPVMEVIELHCLEAFTTSGNNVETVEPEDWMEGNTDWWNA